MMTCFRYYKPNSISYPNVIFPGVVPKRNILHWENGQTKQTSTNGSKKHYNTFTLVELLIVIGVIAVLASLLLPALDKAKSKGMQIACSGNLKQIGYAVAMYQNDWEGYFPGSKNIFFKNLNPYTPIDLAEANNDPCAAKIYWCPADKARIAYRGYYKYSYGAHNYTPWDCTGVQHMKKNTFIKQPSSLIYKAGAKRPNNYLVTLNAGVYPFNASASPEHGIDFRHAKRTNCLWFDFHVSPVGVADIWNNPHAIYQYP